MIDVVWQVASEASGLPDEAAVRRWVAAALEGERDEAEVVVRVVDEPEARQLNRAYRGRDYATNVLSFPSEPPPGFEDLPDLGDLVLCAAVVAREAVEQGKAEWDHWAHLVVHGTLHLLGMDHEAEDQAARMEARECAILARLGITDPYAPR